MLVAKETLDKIKDNFGLNHYEIKIWTSLLSRGIAAASELADISGVPRSRCYDVLESLEKKGFTIMKIGKPIKYIAVKPEEILERIKKNLALETETSLRLIESIRTSDVYNELELLYKTGIERVDAEDITDIYTGKSEINREIKKLAGSASHSIVISTTKEGFQRKLRLLKNILPDAIKQNVKVKFVAPLDYKQIESFEGSYKIKPSDNKLRFVIADKKDTILILTPENTPAESERAILVKSEFVSNMLHELMCM